MAEINENKEMGLVVAGFILGCIVGIGASLMFCSFHPAPPHDTLLGGNFKAAQ